jgi:2-phospho-L-lactate transferase/gluconeogenesis factor (CofD/UPF0052 family)
VPDLADAIRASRAYKIYVGNIATQRGETEGFNLDDHIRVMDEHTGGRLFDVAVANKNSRGVLPADIQFVQAGAELKSCCPLVTADLVDDIHPWRHDSRKLAQIVIDLFQEKAGVLVE